MTFLDRLFTALFELHPLHSMTVHFPIALTAVALFSIVVALWRRSELWEQFAFLGLGLAAVSTIVAGLTGIRDNLVRFDGAAPNVNAKIFLALTLLVLSTVTVVGRWRRGEMLWNPSTTLLYLASFIISFGLAATLGFLGGVILYGF